MSIKIRASPSTKPSYCRNLFGSKKSDPAIKLWLHSTLEAQCEADKARFKEFWGIDLETPSGAVGTGEEPQWSITKVDPIPCYCKPSKGSEIDPVDNVNGDMLSDNEEEFMEIVAEKRIYLVSPSKPFTKPVARKPAGQLTILDFVTKRKSAPKCPGSLKRKLSDDAQKPTDVPKVKKATTVAAGPQI